MEVGVYMSTSAEPAWVLYSICECSTCSFSAALRVSSGILIVVTLESVNIKLGKVDLILFFLVVEMCMIFL